jgi:hypothetical protein
MLAGEASAGQTIQLSLSDVQGIFASEDAARELAPSPEELSRR